MPYTIALKDSILCTVKSLRAPVTPRRLAGMHTCTRAIVNAVLHTEAKKDPSLQQTLMSPYNSRRKRPVWIYSTLQSEDRPVSTDTDSSPLLT